MFSSGSFRFAGFMAGVQKKLSMFFKLLRAPSKMCVEILKCTLIPKIGGGGDFSTLVEMTYEYTTNVQKIR